jgi:hypothetical protein
LMSMARIALLLDKGRSILDLPNPLPRLRTIEISELDLEAIHACMAELVRLRKIAALIGEEVVG